MSDLLEFYLPVLRELRRNSSSVRVTPELVPCPPDNLRSSGLVMKPGIHEYDGWRIDFPQLFGTKDDFGCLGLFVFGAMFHRCSVESRVELIGGPESFRYFGVELSDSVPVANRLQLLPVAYVYHPNNRPTRYPWQLERPCPHELPTFGLMGDAALELERREQVVLCGPSAGAARFAALLLDLSRAENETVEVVLESEPGIRGVGIASVELRIWLPGSDAWPPE
jgi:hypothetical protein